MTNHVLSSGRIATAVGLLAFAFAASSMAAAPGAAAAATPVGVGPACGATAAGATRPGGGRPALRRTRRRPDSCAGGHALQGYIPGLGRRRARGLCLSHARLSGCLPDDLLGPRRFRRARR